MSHWNHRVMRRVYQDGDVVDEVYEVYYNDDGSIEGWTQDPVTPSYYVGVDDGSIVDSIDRFMAAAARPTLDFVTGQEID